MQSLQWGIAHCEGFDLLPVLSVYTAFPGSCVELSVPGNGRSSIVCSNSATILAVCRSLSNKEQH